MKYVIIGGVAGGATAAARIRRNTEKAEIILFERGEYISYANCGLPYYIGGVIEERERLFVQTPEAFGKRFNIDVRTRSEVTGIDTAGKQVTVRTSEGRVYTESYDKLLLSPGDFYLAQCERYRPHQAIHERACGEACRHCGRRFYRTGDG